jgi:hypothetical protein
MLVQPVVIAVNHQGNRLHRQEMRVMEFSEFQGHLATYMEHTAGIHPGCVRFLVDLAISPRGVGSEPLRDGEEPNPRPAKIG